MLVMCRLLSLLKLILDQIFVSIKLRMEMGNVPKRQQPDHWKKQQQKVTNRSSKHSSLKFLWQLLLVEDCMTIITEHFCLGPAEARLSHVLLSIGFVINQTVSYSFNYVGNFIAYYTSLSVLIVGEFPIYVYIFNNIVVTLAIIYHLDIVYHNLFMYY